MNRDLALKYQAFVDGELPEREARAMAEAIERDPEAQALIGELRATKNALAGNEPEVVVPETREFYWNKIQQAIERLDAASTESRWITVLAAWRRFLAPLAGVAVIAFLAVTAVRFYNSPLVDDLTQHLAEIENLSEHSTSMSFRSDNMFVVWVQDTSSHDADGQVELIDNDEVMPQ
jgi:anti-sigma factor RsiW